MKVFYKLETGEIIQVTNSDYISQETNFIEIDEFPPFIKPKVDLDKMTINESVTDEELQQKIDLKTTQIKEKYKVIIEKLVSQSIINFIFDGVGIDKEIVNQRNDLLSQMNNEIENLTTGRENVNIEIFNKTK